MFLVFSRNAQWRRIALQCRKTRNNESENDKQEEPAEGSDRQRIGQARIARLAAGLRQTTKALSAHAAVLDCPNMRKRSALIG